MAISVAATLVLVLGVGAALVALWPRAEEPSVTVLQSQDAGSTTEDLAAEVTPTDEAVRTEEATPAAEPTAEVAPAALTDSDIAQQFGDSVYRLEAEGCGGVSSGTGWVLDDRHLVTNWHVVSGDPTPEVIARDGEVLQGEVIGGTTDPDVAVVRTDGGLNEPLPWADTDDLTEGQEIVALGYPAPGLDFSVTPGSILSFQLEGSDREAIRTDGAVDKGNSGGPALDRTGAVAGVVTQMADNAGAFQVVPLLFTQQALESAVADMVADPESVEADCDPDFVVLPEDWEGGAPAEDAPQAYGDDAALDGLQDACEAGDMAACDDLYWDSPVGSDYEAVANTCGGTTDEPGYGTCEWGESIERADAEAQEAAAHAEAEAEAEAEAQEAEAQAEVDETEAQAEADEAAAQAQAAEALDALVTECEAGDMQACDDLSYEAGYGTDAYETADACGGHFPDGYLSCVDREADAATVSALVTECEAGDMQACDDLSYEADLGTDAYETADACGGHYPDAYGGGCTYAEEDAAEVQALYDACAGGEMAACDDLYFAADVGSDSEEFGATCGGLREASAGLCTLDP